MGQLIDFPLHRRSYQFADYRPIPAMVYILPTVPFAPANSGRAISYDEVFDYSAFSQRFMIAAYGELGR